MDGAADGTKRGLAAACGYTEGLHAIRPNGTVLDPADIECLVEAFQSALQVTAGEGAAGIMTKHDAVACLSRHDWDLRRTVPAIESEAVQDLIRARRSGWLARWL